MVPFLEEREGAFIDLGGGYDWYLGLLLYC
jgi:hypothetical protein